MAQAVNGFRVDDSSYLCSNWSGDIPFEQIIADWQGNCCWFKAVDRRSDPTITETLQAALKQLIPVPELTLKGLNPQSCDRSTS